MTQAIPHEHYLRCIPLSVVHERPCLPNERCQKLNLQKRSFMSGNFSKPNVLQGINVGTPCVRIRSNSHEVTFMSNFSMAICTP